MCTRSRASIHFYHYTVKLFWRLAVIIQALPCHLRRPCAQIVSLKISSPLKLSTLRTLPPKLSWNHQHFLAPLPGRLAMFSIPVIGQTVIKSVLINILDHATYAVTLKKYLIPKLEVPEQLQTAQEQKKQRY